MMWWLVAAVVAAGAPATGDGGYWPIVERYRRGEHAEAVRALAALPPATVAREVQAVTRLEDRAEHCDACPAREELQGLPLRAAAMLHTDRACPPGGTLVDAAELRVANVFLQAGRLLPGDNEGFARRWRLAVMLEAFVRTDGALALGLGRQGLRDFPDDGPLLLAMGTLEESLASPGGPGLLEGRDADRSLLEAAAKTLEAAARAAEDPAEALVRLGRVQALPRRGPAPQTLASALGRTREPRLVCLARLCLGALDENAGRLESATREYRQAIEAVPAAEVPRVALSQVLRRRGEIRAAQEALQAALRWPPRADGADPWWAYPWGHSREADALLARLREDAR